MLNAATQVLFEGVPTHPDAGRAWDIVDKYKARPASRAGLGFQCGQGPSHVLEVGSECQCGMCQLPVNCCIAWTITHFKAIGLHVYNAWQLSITARGHPFHSMFASLYVQRSHRCKSLQLSRWMRVTASGRCRCCTRRPRPSARCSRSGRSG